MATPSPKVEVVLKNVVSRLGEGPHWDDASQTLYFVDIDGHQAHRYNAATGQHDFKQLDEPVTPIVPRQGGGFIIGLGRKFAQLNWDTGAVSVIKEVDAGTNNRFNDGKCDAKGRLWAGTVSPGPGGFIEGGGSLYTLDLDRSVKEKVPELTISNGLAWTNDNRTMFLVDSQPKNIYAFDFDLEAGTIASERTVVQFPADSGITERAVPDGMTIDTNDKLWVSFYDGGVVAQVDPETGKTLQKISIPATQTTSVSWGGANLDELYLTCGRNLSDAEFQNQPLAGSLFKITGLGAKGRPAYIYQG